MRSLFERADIDRLSCRRSSVIKIVDHEPSCRPFSPTNVNLVALCTLYAARQNANSARTNVKRRTTTLHRFSQANRTSSIFLSEYGQLEIEGNRSRREEREDVGRFNGSRRPGKRCSTRRAIDGTYMKVKSKRRSGR